MTLKRYFGTDGIRGRVGEGAITPDFILKLGWAAGRVLSPGTGGKVLIGKDTRVSGYMLESALEAGLSAAGVDVLLLGPMPTPAIAYLTRTFRAAAGIVISASHNPYYDNGIKFFSPQGDKLSDELELAIEAAVQQPLATVSSDKLGKASRVNDAVGRYIEFCKSTFPSKLSLAGLKLVIDCANGATYHIADSVFEELGAEVVAINAEPNGFNINEQCGSTAPDLLCAAVIEHQADVGIAFDGDGDRVIMVNNQGQRLDGDELLYLMALDSYSHGSLQGGVVGTVMTNLGLELALRKQGIDFTRVQVGDRYVIEELQRRNWALGGETSGHIVCRAVTTTGDGIISALQVLAAMQRQEKSLAELTQGFERVPQVQVNVVVNEQHIVARDQAIQDALLAEQAALGDAGRIILRPSGTEPLVRIMVESQSAAQGQTIADRLAQKIQQTAKALELSLVGSD